MWWLSLKSGDQVFVPMERNKRSGMAEVYSNGRKYISISLHGRSMRVRKSDGCIDEYPYNQIRRDEKDHMDSVWQRKKFRDSVEILSKILSSSNRINESDVHELQRALNKIQQESK